ncbi:Cytochrome bo(3) ubiquinol oxidase subunit 4 [Candidatus Ecksteinia adelgidicola]|nr:Cytochrome bo(3) ubiquinol oxidase subunit 4 [Candidatus Ecksteinia adelgidicola]
MSFLCSDFYSRVNNNSIQSKLVGFIFSIILTIIPFLIVIKRVFSDTIVFYLIISMAIIQILIHLIYFLNINTSLEKRWDLAALIFTSIIISIILIGSLWIMHHLNINMKNN